MGAKDSPPNLRLEKYFLVRSFGGAKESIKPSNLAGQYLPIRIQILNCSSPFVVNLKCFTCADSGFQMPNLKTFSFPGGEIPSCLYKVPDLDGESGQLLIEVTPPPD
jgi:hypothetical protein